MAREKISAMIPENKEIKIGKTIRCLNIHFHSNSNDQISLMEKYSREHILKLIMMKNS